VTERVTLITGASAGIGTELARVFAANAHRVALVARRADRLKTLADEIVASGGAAPILIPCDLEARDAGDKVAAALKEYSPKYNKGRRIDVVSQRLGYLVRSGDPDALDSIVPMAFGNLALDLILKKEFGRLVSVHKGFYDSVPITSVTSEKKIVDVKKYYNTDRLRPIYEFDGAPLFIMTSD